MMKSSPGTKILVLTFLHSKAQLYKKRLIKFEIKVIHVLQNYLLLLYVNHYLNLHFSIPVKLSQFLNVLVAVQHLNQQLRWIPVSSRYRRIFVSNSHTTLWISYNLQLLGYIHFTEQQVQVWQVNLNSIYPQRLTNIIFGNPLKM